MPLELPRLEQTSCEILTACAHVLTGSDALLQKLAKEDPMTARYGAGSGASYLRVLPGGKSGKHLHIDCALAEYFAGRKRPKTTHRKAEVLRFLDSALGSSVDVCVRTGFVLPLSELPERGFIRSLCSEEGAAGVSIKLIEGRASITGAPARSIWWSVDQKKGEVTVQMEADRSTEVKETYLKDCLDWGSGLLHLFVLGKVTDASE